MDNLTLWYFMFFLGMIPVNYYALNAVDFSKIFRRNSTWQIKVLILFLSVIISYLFSTAIIESIERFIGVISK